MNMFFHKTLKTHPKRLTTGPTTVRRLVLKIKKTNSE